MKPLLMNSLPNSGSTWLADCIAACLPLVAQYSMEYFNPLRNTRHEAVLSQYFGSELVASYKHIALPGARGAAEAIQRTWFQEPPPLSFTKEVFSPYKTGLFVRAGFEVFVMTRGADTTFPPARARIWSFYEHAWHAMNDAGCGMQAGASVRERAREAHTRMQEELLAAAMNLELPVVEWESLFGTSAEIGAKLSFLANRVDIDKLVDRIITTRKHKSAPQI